MSFASGGLFLALPGFAVGGAEPLVSDIPLLRTKGKLTWVARKPHSSRLPCVRLHLFCCHGQHHKFGSLRAFAVMPLTLLTAGVPPRFVAAKSATLRPVQKARDIRPLPCGSSPQKVTLAFSVRLQTHSRRKCYATIFLRLRRGDLVGFEE